MMTVKITVHLRDKYGRDLSETFTDESLPVCISRVRRKYQGCKIIGDTSSVLSRKDKCIPDPPEGWKFTSFSTAMKKDRWGRLRHIGEEL